MTTIGIDLEQFIRDPYATGIQRVLQQLALHWPVDVDAHWIAPGDDGTFSLLDRQQAAELLTLPFVSVNGTQLREQVARTVRQHHADRDVPHVRYGQLISLYDGWLLPEVSYLPTVLGRLDIFSRTMPVTMIGYDALPMTEPANYRFVPGTGANVSEYFRRLATVDSVVCISDYSRSTVLDRLRRSRTKRTTVAHPGGDHLPIRVDPGAAANQRPRFLRLGTMEARKHPLEILRGFQRAVREGTEAELVFIGNPNASAQAVNNEVNRAIADGYPVTWVQGATDAQVHDFVHAGDAFLSVGVEGYGIPVLESIRLGTPVLFDGIQPAGDLMAGQGARRVPALTEQDLAAVFATYGAPGALAELRQTLNVSAVPTWSSFTEAVVREATRS